MVHRSFQLKRLVVVTMAGIATVSCAAGQAMRLGDRATRAGDPDQAVAYYRKAVQTAPENARYKIALERAMQSASRLHMERARDFEQKDQLEAALGEYRLAAENDPSNRLAATKVAALERTIRDRVEAARPKPALQQLQERASRATPSPILNPASRTPLIIQFNNVALRDILTFIGNLTGINILYDRDYVDRPATVQLNGVTLEQALNQILSTNQLSFKVMNERTVVIFADTPVKHAQYDDQVVRVFFLANADATEISQVLSSILRIPNLGVQPMIIPNKTTNTITVRATTALVQIMEKVIAQNDKPRAELVFDVEILEVDRQRAAQYGLNLSNYAIGTVFSPVVAPGTTTTAATGTTTGTTTPATTTSGTSTQPTAVVPSPPFNLNTISRGLTTADFYLALPTAVVNFLESDTHTKLVAHPQLRGTEGTKLSLNLGQQTPIVSTSYTPIATGGVGVNPLNSFQLKDIGINIDITVNHVTLDGDILMDLYVESSTIEPQTNIAGTNYPQFGSRKVTTRLRLRDGESNLLAGLLRQDEQTSVTGFPGAIHIPFLSQALSGNSNSAMQIDLVMLLTPHIIRTQEITEDDLKPIFIGAQGMAGGTLGVGGPPSMIAPQPEPPAAPPVAAPAGPPGAAAPSQPGLPITSLSGAIVAAPPGSSPVPGTVVVQPAPAPSGAAPLPPAPPAAAPVTIEPPAVAPVPPVPPVPPAVPAPPDAAVTTPGVGLAQVIITPPGTTFRVSGGPYTFPITVTGASRLSAVTLTVMFDPALLRVRSVQPGGFMNSGGANPSFVQQVNNGRVDITIARPDDAMGATGLGVLAAVLFDAVAPGTATLTLSGSATGPGGTPMGLQFRSVTIMVQP